MLKTSRNSYRRQLVYFLLLAFLALSKGVDPVSAKPGSVECTPAYEENTKPHLLVLNCTPGFASAHDRVRISRIADSFDPTESWWQNVRFQGEIWEFDVRADGTIQLAVEYIRERSIIVASIYHDRNGDGQIRPRVENGRLIVPETPYPPLKAIVEGNWFLPDGHLNWNVRFQTDGASISHIHTFDLTDGKRRFLDYDGTADVELEFSDENEDGVPERGLWRLLAPTPDSSGVRRTFLWVNTGEVSPQVHANAIFWPYLTDSSSAQNYFDAPPGIVVNWQDARIEQISFAGYPIERGFHTNTIEYFKKEETNYANFENAQAYYDLAADNDGAPELHIRHRYFAANDPFGWNLPVPINGIRWSWDQTTEAGRRGWDYKLGLAGRHVIDSHVHFSDFSYLTVPYAELPQWIRSRDWEWATFIAREEASPSRSAEGIYTWSGAVQPIDGDESRLSRYLAGQDQIDPRDAYQQVPIGWRGEFAPLLQGSPHLYFSAIDRNIHLVGAEYGIWTRDETSQIRYEDLDGDGYFDQWNRLQEAHLTESLTLAGDYIFYSKEGRVAMKTVAFEPVLFESYPPITHQEWRHLGQRISQNSIDSPRADLEPLFTQIPGTATAIAGAFLANVRLGDGSYRFELSLEPGHDITGPDLLGAADLASGAYLVESDGGPPAVTPLTPPELSVTVYSSLDEQLETDGLASAYISVENTGLADANDVALVVAWRRDANTMIEMERLSLDVLAGETAHELVSLPLQSGSRSTVHIWVENAQGQRLTEKQMMAYDGNNEKRSREQILATLQIGSRRQALILATLIIALLLTLAAGARTMLLDAD